MSRVIISESAANPFLSADGLLNFDAIAKVQDKVAAALKADKEGELKIASVYVINRKAKPVKYTASLEKKGDHKYRLRRAIKIANRKRVKPESLARVAVLLQVVEGMPKTVAEQTKKIESAINQHMKKIEKVVAKVKGEKEKIRDAANKVFDKSVDLLTAALTGDSKLKDSDIVVSQGMMGKTVLVKVGKDNVIAVTKADMTRFKAAKKAAAENQ